ncbi:hypothetical protein BJ165DRAFT_607438 [Panaeolus papilionaceus]|nr:hypothetical protein BJ165DRAFT_607438 [Panaeolus papilionaceus]
MPPKTKTQKAHTKAVSKAREALQRKKRQESIAPVVTNDSQSISTPGAVKKTSRRKTTAANPGSSASEPNAASTPAPLRAFVANGQTPTYYDPSPVQVIQPQPVPLQDPATFVILDSDATAVDRSALITVLRACQAELGFWRRQHPDAVTKVMTLELENRRLRTELEVEKQKCANMMNGFRGLDMMVKNAAREYSQLLIPREK